MKVAIDNHYTPLWLAKVMALLLPEATTGMVADYAVGGGALLDAAEMRFGDRCRYVAGDIDPAALRYLKATRPHWTVGRLDLLSSASRAASRVWNADVAAVLLNPPFSYRGGAGMMVQTGSRPIRASPAAACLMAALAGVRIDGLVVALLPSNTMQSERDREVWRHLARHHRVEVTEEFSRSAFLGAHARTTLVVVTKRSAESSSTVEECDVSILPSAGRPSVELIRGRVPVHQLARLKGGADAVPFLHTTDLRENRYLASGRSASPAYGTMMPAVLVPRIGKPLASKVVTIAEPRTYVLSDCVYALRPEDGDVHAFAASLESRFGELARAYGGSCAPYLTIKRFVQVLEGWGYGVVVTGASAAR